MCELGTRGSTLDLSQSCRRPKKDSHRKGKFKKVVCALSIRIISHGPVLPIKYTWGTRNIKTGWKAG